MHIQAEAHAGPEHCHQHLGTCSLWEWPFCFWYLTCKVRGPSCIYAIPRAAHVEAATRLPRYYAAVFRSERI